MVALKAVKIQRSQGQEKAVIRTQELVLIRVHSKEKARYKKSYKTCGKFSAGLRVAFLNALLIWLD